MKNMPFFTKTLPILSILRYSILLLLTLLLTSSCSSIMVSHDYDSTAPFSQYSHYSFEAKDPERITDARSDNELLNKRFYSIIQERLQKQGFNKAQISEKANFIVAFHYSIRPKMDLGNIGTQIGFSYGSYSRYGGIGSRTCTDISEFDQGILIIEIKDATNGNLVWQGTGSDIVSIHATPEKITTQVNKLVKSVLALYPPQ